MYPLFYRHSTFRAKKIKMSYVGRKLLLMKTYPATENQIAFIERLISERIYEGEIALAQLNKLDASMLIKQLLEAPRRGASINPTTIAEGLCEGLYQTDLGIYRVELSEQSRLYARHLNPAGGWTYERGAVYRLLPEQRMTLAQAQEFGVKYGVCCVCGRLLSDAESVANGIGPICATNTRFF